MSTRSIDGSHLVSLIPQAPFDVVCDAYIDEEGNWLTGQVIVTVTRE